MVWKKWWNFSEASETPGYLDHFKSHKIHHTEYSQTFCEMVLEGAFFTSSNELLAKNC